MTEELRPTSHRIAVVVSLNAVDRVDGNGRPTLSFETLNEDGRNVHYLELEDPYATSAIVPILCAAFATGERLKLWFKEVGGKQRVDFIQLEKLK